MEGSQRLSELPEFTKLRLAKTGSSLGLVVPRPSFRSSTSMYALPVCARHCARSGRETVNKTGRAPVLLARVLTPQRYESGYTSHAE